MEAVFDWIFRVVAGVAAALVGWFIKLVIELKDRVTSIETFNSSAVSNAEQAHARIEKAIDHLSDEVKHSNEKRGEIHSKIDVMKSELKDQISNVRDELKDDIHNVELELHKIELDIAGKD